MILCRVEALHLFCCFYCWLWKGKYLLGSNEVFQTKEKGVKFFLYFCITGIVLVSMISSNVFITNFEHISHFFLVFLLLTLNKYMLIGLVNGLYLDMSRQSWFYVPNIRFSVFSILWCLPANPDIWLADSILDHNCFLFDSVRAQFNILRKIKNLICGTFQTRFW